MRLLLIDHGCCDVPDTRVHHCREHLEKLGVQASACGPSSISQLASHQPGLHGIHLHDVAAASKLFLRAVQDGTPIALLEALATISPSLLGLVRETARQMVAEAVDANLPDVIFVFHAGILTDLAIETGVPVVVHVSFSDLVVAGRNGFMRQRVTAAIASCNGIVATDADTAQALRQEWLSDDVHSPDEQVPIVIWPPSPHSAADILAVCQCALSRRQYRA